MKTLFFLRITILSFSLLFLPPFLSFINSQSVPVISYETPQVYNTGIAVASLAPTNSGGAVPATVPGMVSTLAGNETSGSVDGIGTEARFDSPEGVAVDASGYVYVADYYNSLIRKITPEGVVTTLAGSAITGTADGTGAAAQFNGPWGICVDVSGTLYVGEQSNNRIRKVTTDGGIVTTFAGSSYGFADGIGTAAKFDRPIGVALDAIGNLFVADCSNNMIRKITSAAVVSRFAGSGSSGSTDAQGSAARFYQPSGVAVDASGNIYVGDYRNHRIRKITQGGLVSTFAGSWEGYVDDTGLAAEFSYPKGLAVDVLENIYVADSYNNRIRKISPAGVVTTVAGSTYGYADGIGTNAKFYQPAGLAVDAAGTIYVADCNNNMIRKITPFGYSISPALPEGLSFDATTGSISGTPTAVSSATTYTIRAENIAGSSTTTISIEVKNIATDVSGLSNTGIRVYTNAVKQISVVCQDITSGSGKATIYNAMGQKLITQQLPETKTIIQHHLKSGVYLVEVETGSERSVQIVVLK